MLNIKHIIHLTITYLNFIFIFNYQQTQQTSQYMMTTASLNINPSRKESSPFFANSIDHALPLISCSIHYKPRYGKWEEVVFPARNLQVRLV